MRLLCLASVLLPGLGCASDPKVTLATAGHSYLRTFDRACCSVTAGGDDVIVLTTHLPGHSGGAGLVHVLRIRTLWHPVVGAKPNSPAATNAALHYFVTAPLESSYIHYAGTGFVTVDHGRSSTRVVIRNANLTRVDSHGSLTDPLKTFTLSGEFDAVDNSRQVDAILADLSRTVPKNSAAPATAPTSGSTPP